MDISIPFTNLKFTGKVLWNFPNDDAEKQEISKNNAILVALSYCIIISYIFLPIPHFIVSLLGFLLVGIACQRKMHSYIFSGDNKVEALKGAVISVHTFTLGVLFVSLITLPFNGLDGIFHFIQLCAFAFYVYVYRDVVGKGWAHFKSKPWF